PNQTLPLEQSIKRELTSGGGVSDVGVAIAVGDATGPADASEQGGAAQGDVARPHRGKRDGRAGTPLLGHVAFQRTHRRYGELEITIECQCIPREIEVGVDDEHPNLLRSGMRCADYRATGIIDRSERPRWRALSIVAEEDRSAHA